MSSAPESKMVKSSPAMAASQSTDPFELEGIEAQEKNYTGPCLPDSEPGCRLKDGFSDSSTAEEKKPLILKDNLKVCTCSCHTSSSYCIFDEKFSESIRFRELLLLHLDMIEEQSAMLQLKEKQLNNLRIENEQLNARLNRMERRVALKVRKNTNEMDINSAKGKSLHHKRCYSLGGLDTDNKKKKSSISGSSCINVTSKQFKDNATGRFLATDVDYLKLNMYTVRNANDEKQEASKIAVPSWKDVPIDHIPKVHRSKNTDKSVPDGLDEITDDESYQRRHLKMELDEIRRKRWDIQQMRQERIHENLRQKQREREEPLQQKEKSKIPSNNIKSLHPPPGNAMVIEVANEIPVFALGSRISHFEPTEFDLPWFDVAKREIQHRQKQMKSGRGQRRKTWYKL